MIIKNLLINIERNSSKVNLKFEELRISVYSVRETNIPSYTQDGRLEIKGLYGINFDTLNAERDIKNIIEEIREEENDIFIWSHNIQESYGPFFGSILDQELENLR